MDFKRKLEPGGGIESKVRVVLAVDDNTASSRKQASARAACAQVDVRVSE